MLVLPASGLTSELQMIHVWAAGLLWILVLLLMSSDIFETVRVRFVDAPVPQTRVG